MSRAPDEKMAVILSGGGAYGAYEVGVMKALLGGEMKGAGYQPLDPQVFTGTSVGSFNASVMVSQPGVPAGQTVKLLERFWLNDIAESSATCGNGVFRFRGNPLSYLNPVCFANPLGPLEDSAGDAGFLARSLFARSLNSLMTPGGVINRALQFVDLSAFISVEPFREMLMKTIGIEAIRHSDKELRVVATNWETGEVKIFENHHIGDETFGRQVIMASAAIPGIFPPVKINDVTYVDGGVVMNTPLKCAIQAGATTLFVIYLDPDIENIPLQRLMNTLDTMDRVYTIMLATKINEDVDTAAWINEGLQALEQLSHPDASLSDAQARDFIRVAGRIRDHVRGKRLYRKLTIHRFHPHDDLGGPLGMLDFNLEAITGMIARGYEDAVYHDCYESHCIFPDGPAPRPQYLGSSWLQTAL